MDEITTKNPHSWLDRIIAEQAAFHGPKVTALIRGAAEAQDRLGDGELDPLVIPWKELTHGR